MWRGDIGEECALALMPKRLELAQALRSGTKVRVCFKLEPWNEVQETSASVRDDGFLDVESEVNIFYPGWRNEKESPRLVTTITTQGKQIGKCRAAIEKVFQGLSAENPLSCSFYIGNDAHILLDIVALDVQVAQSQQRFSLHREGDSKRRFRGARQVDMEKLVSKVSQMMDNALANLLGGRVWSAAFSEFDTRKDDTVAKPDFVKVLRNLEFRLTVPEFEVLCNMLDENGNGRIHYKKLAFVLGRQTKQEETERYSSVLTVDDSIRRKLHRIVRKAKEKGLTPRQIFSHFDRQGSGKISKSDFQLGLSQLGFKLSIRELVVLVNELDANQDGMVSLDEFEAFAQAPDNLSQQEQTLSNGNSDDDKDQSDRLDSSESSSDSSSESSDSEEDDIVEESKLTSSMILSIGERVWAKRKDAGYSEATIVRAQTRPNGKQRYVVRFHGHSEKTRQVKPWEVFPRRSFEEIERLGRQRSAKALAQLPDTESKLQEENNKLKELLSLSRKRLGELEERCAAAEANSHMIIARAARKAALDERTKLESHFTKLIADKLKELYTDEDEYSMFPEKCEEVTLREKAHLAFEQVLEAKISTLTGQLRQGKYKGVVQERLGNQEHLRSRRLEAILFSKRDLFSATIDELGVRSSSIVRALVHRAVLRGCRSCKDLFKPDLASAGDDLVGDEDPKLVSFHGVRVAVTPFKLVEEDMVELERDFVRCGMSHSFLHRRKTRNQGIDTLCLDIMVFGEGLDRCKEWDLLQALEEDELNTEIETHGPTRVLEDPSMPRKLFDLALIASRDRDGVGALAWFKGAHFVSGSRIENALELEVVNDQLVLRNLPAFEGVAELEAVFSWLDQSLGEKTCTTALVNLWKEERLVDIEALVHCINRLADLFIEQKQRREAIEALRYEEENPMMQNMEQDESAPCQEKADLAKENLFDSFSNDEHSMRWPPLSNFGKVPFDCVRILEQGRVAEYNSTRARSIMAFVAGELSELSGKNAVSIRMEKAVEGNGFWSLCVTSGPPMNRPARGSAMYAHTGEARIEGSVQVGKSCLITDMIEDEGFFTRWEMVPLDLLAMARAECSSDDRALERVYSRFMPKSVLWNLLSSVANLVQDKLGREEQEVPSDMRVLKMKAVELEAQLRMNHPQAVNKVLGKDHWTLDSAFTRAGGGQERGLSITEVTACAVDLYRDYRDMMGTGAWSNLLNDLIDRQLVRKDKPPSRVSFEMFSSFMQKLEQGVQEHFRCSSKDITIFRKEVNETLAKLDRKRNLHFRPVVFGDTISAVVDYSKGAVSFFVNGEFQTRLTPTCPRPWRFAWHSNRSGVVRILSNSSSKKINKK